MDKICTPFGNLAAQKLCPITTNPLCKRFHGLTERSIIEQNLRDFSGNLSCVKTLPDNHEPALQAFSQAYREVDY
ncbi:MAG: hypothetical protein ACI4JT_04725 [Oscillospiraceae bacterium]